MSHFLVTFLLHGSPQQVRVPAAHYTRTEGEIIFFALGEWVARFPAIETTSISPAIHHR